MIEELKSTSAIMAFGIMFVFLPPLSPKLEDVLLFLSAR